jgi:hypothetical protein
MNDLLQMSMKIELLKNWIQLVRYLLNDSTGYKKKSVVLMSAENLWPNNCFFIPKHGNFINTKQDPTS